MRARSQVISGWGNYPVLQSQVYRPESLARLQDVVRRATHILPFGSRLSYGDAPLASVTIDMRMFDKILAFDKTNGIVTVEAGVTFGDLLDFLVLQGWFIPVVPGTKHLTVGGAVASNVHGKNHHRVGSFGNFVRSLDIVTANGTLVSCSLRKNKDLFTATVGGMGLTCVICAVTLRLKKISSVYMDVMTEKCSDLVTVFRALEKLDATHEYTVCWIDGYSRRGRGVVIAGNHLEGNNGLFVRKKSQFCVPFTVSSVVTHPVSVNLFTFLYYTFSRTGRRVGHYDPFFFPLDRLRDWNRLYGKHGFTQYQCVFPVAEAEGGVTDVLAVLRDHGMGSYLTVLKRFGPDDGLVSFPMEGYTLAVDFPVNEKTDAVVYCLDAIVLRRKGRVYLAKDAFSQKEVFVHGYPRFREWKKIKKKWDPKNKFVSLQAQRLIS